MRIPEESFSIWKGHYEELVDSLRLPLAPREHRKFPRLEMLQGADISLSRGGENSRVQDISAGGMAFYATRPVPDGNEVLLTMENAFNVFSEVVYCRPDEEAGNGIMDRFRVGTRFLREEDGYKFAVLAMETYHDKLARR